MRREPRSKPEPTRFTPATASSRENTDFRASPAKSGHHLHRPDPENIRSDGRQGLGDQALMQERQRPDPCRAARRPASNTVEDAQQGRKNSAIRLSSRRPAGGGGKGMRSRSGRPTNSRAPSRVARSEGQNYFGERHRLHRTLHQRTRSTSRSRSSATRTATSCTYSSANARSNAATKRSSKKRPASFRLREGRARKKLAKPRPRRASNRLRRSRHDRIHLRQPNQRFLLHGDEHAPSGRAPDHRDGHRCRPRRTLCRSRSRSASPCRSSRRSSPSTAGPSRPASARKIPDAISRRLPASSST